MAVWGVPVRWGKGKGDVALQDPFTGEWHEIAGDRLADDNPHLDLRWLRRRAAAHKFEAGAGVVQHLRDLLATAPQPLSERQH